MDLEISLDKDFKVKSVSFRSNNTSYNECQIMVDSKIIITKFDSNVLRINDGEKILSYFLDDFDYLTFNEYEIGGKYSVALYDDDYLNTILQYLDWRKVNYEIRNA